MDNMEDYYMAEENLWGAERGAFVSPVSLSLQISLAFLPGPVPGLGVGVGLLVLPFCCFPFSGKFVTISTHSSCWPTMSRTSPAMQEQKRECLAEVRSVMGHVVRAIALLSAAKKIKAVAFWQWIFSISSKVDRTISDQSAHFTVPLNGRHTFDLMEDQFMMTVFITFI